MTQDHDNHEVTDEPVWIQGEFLLRVQGSGPRPAQTLRIARPFALIGHAPDADIRINDRGVSAQHAYLHLDHRGLYVIDLLSRGGTQLPNSNEMAGWLTPGDWVEIAGRRIELVRIEVDGHTVSPAPCAEDPLRAVEPGTFLPVSLGPEDHAAPPWTLDSELVFLGRSAGCGIPLKDDSVAKIQSVFYRTPSAAYLVDLAGPSPLTNGPRVRNVTRLRQGLRLTFGSTSYVVQIGTNEEPDLPVPNPQPSHDLPLVARVIQPEIEDPAQASVSSDLRSVEPGDALLAWMAESFQETQNQNAELQRALVQLLQKMQDDNASLIHAQLSRMDTMDREIAALRSETARQTSLPAPAESQPPALPAPLAPPLQIARPESDSRPADPTSAASWLLERVSQVDEFELEDESLWKKWLSRLSRLRPR